MAKYIFPSFLSVYISFTIVRMFLTASFVYASSVQLGPAGEYEEFSEVVFLGEDITLECSRRGMPKCEMSLYLNDVVIYGEGQHLPRDYDITKCEMVSCCWNIRITNVTIRHNGTYKCLVLVGNTDMENSYELNVVTERPYCLAKYLKSDDGFQLFCYTFKFANESSLLMRWEITKSGSNPMTFTQFKPTHPARTTELHIQKIVGVSQENIKKENLTIEYRCSHVNDTSQSCFICLTCPVTGGVLAPTTGSALETSQHTQQHQSNELSTKSPPRNSTSPMSTTALETSQHTQQHQSNEQSTKSPQRNSTLPMATTALKTPQHTQQHQSNERSTKSPPRNSTSPMSTTDLETSQHTQQHQSNELSKKNSVRNTIIVSFTAVLVILSVIAVILIYKTKHGDNNKCEEPNVRDKGQELSQTGTPLKRLPTNHKDVQYEEITDICATEHSGEIEGKLPDEDTAIPSRDIYTEVEMCDCHSKNHLSNCDGRRHLSESNDDSKMIQGGAVSSSPDDFNTINMVYCVGYKTFETE